MNLPYFTQFFPVSPNYTTSTWQAQLVGCATFDIRVVGLTPTMGVEMT